MDSSNLSQHLNAFFLEQNKIKDGHGDDDDDDDKENEFSQVTILKS